MNKNISIPTSPINVPWYVFLLLAVALGIGAGVAIKELGVWALLLIPGIFLFAGVLLLHEVALPTFVFVIYINLSANMITFYGAPSIAKPLVALLTLLLFIRVVFLGQELRGLQLPILMLVSYTLIGAISLIYVADFDAGYKALVEYMKIAVYSILVVAFLQKASTLHNVIWVLILSGILMGSISIYQYFTGTVENIYWGFGQSYASDTGTGYRVGGVVGDPNYYAMILAVLVPIAFDRFWHATSKIMKLLAIWALIVSVLAILYTYSRGGFLTLCLAIVVIAFQYKLRLVPAMVLIVFALIVSQFLPANYTERLSTLAYFLPQSTGQQLVDKSIRGRTSANLAAWEMFKDFPLMGVGISNYENLYYAYARPLGLDMSRGAQQPHNLYFQILAERGLIGISIFLMIMIITLRNLYHSQKIFKQKNLIDLAGISNAMIVALLIYMFSSIFLHDSFIRYFWILIGIAWSIPQLANYEENRQGEY